MDYCKLYVVYSCCISYNILFTDYNISIITTPVGYPALGTNNTYDYLSGTNLKLTCSVVPAPPFGSLFSWRCSTGCFADMRTTQSIYISNLRKTNTGVLNCSAIIDGVQYFSGPFGLQVADGT